MTQVNRKLILSLVLLYSFFCALSAQNSLTRLSLLFTGDIMCHDTQMAASYNSKLGTYNFYDSFKRMEPIVSKADIAFANLELVLGGSPYRSYPDFSAPDEIAFAARKCGFDVMLMASNHSVDKGRKGIMRTSHVLDSLGFYYTGAFVDSLSWAKNHPLIITKNDMVIAVMNYTYGLNGGRVPKGAYINIIDTTLLKMDILHAKESRPDAIVVYLHWGIEYVTMPSLDQKKLCKWLANNGVDLIVGAHPHVVQPMEWHNNIDDNYLVAYSLGNFLSGQRTSPRQGGAILEVELTKENSVTKISNASYSLTYVHYPKIDGIRHFQVIAVNDTSQVSMLKEWDGTGRMNLYKAEAQKILNKSIAIYEK